jgi:hypothetical protein
MALESFLGFVRKKSTPSHQTMEESWIAEPVLLSKAAVLQPEAKQLPLDLSRISLLHDSRS